MNAKILVVIVVLLTAPIGSANTMLETSGPTALERLTAFNIDMLDSFWLPENLNASAGSNEPVLEDNSEGLQGYAGNWTQKASHLYADRVIETTQHHTSPSQADSLTELVKGSLSPIALNQSNESAAGASSKILLIFGGLLAALSLFFIVKRIRREDNSQKVD